MNVIELSPDPVPAGAIASVGLLMGDDQGELEARPALLPRADTEGIGAIGIACIAESISGECVQGASYFLAICVLQLVAEPDNVLTALAVGEFPFPFPYGGIQIGHLATILVTGFLFFALIGENVTRRTRAGSVGKYLHDDSVIAGGSTESGGCATSA
ncbi:hypothetical protein [Ensifer aridi]|uniref:hypothetical protein n=1 Tax=Ensifer aridi TaxID=1708715 RepID=UPI001FCD9912|nr:hypothetical protein [Ensifer aridi]